MYHLRKLAPAAAAATLLIGLTACGDDGSTAEPQAEQTAPNGDVYNQADVDFATEMIPHHAQALMMVDMARGRELSPEVEALTAAIQAAQTPEIEQMADWLTAWDEPVPETVRDHANAEGHGMDDDGMGDDHSAGMPGMMTDEEQGELEAAQGDAFETMWLEMMIEHHEGAIEMAEAEQADGVFDPAKELAESIAESQQAEIDQMEELLAS